MVGQQLHRRPGHHEGLRIEDCNAITVQLLSAQPQEQRLQPAILAVKLPQALRTDEIARREVVMIMRLDQGVMVKQTAVIVAVWRLPHPIMSEWSLIGTEQAMYYGPLKGGA
ncbi:hypothetical protein [Furfurilactobacillus entadae]|uniref:hypothetical protein n=1 Tax=Furfurilactobacillus entadae TaxID=2922307 RepID=UPI0035E615B3